MEDQEIVDQILHHHRQELYALLVRRYSSLVFAKSLSVTHDRELAEEVAHQTFIKAYTHLEDWRGGGSIAPWLTIVAMHTALKIVDKRQRHPSAPLDERLPSTDDYSPQHEARLQQLEQCIETLPPADRELIQLHYYEHLKTQEVAQRTHLSLSNVLVRLHRIRERLKQQLSPPDEE